MNIWKMWQAAGSSSATANEPGFTMPFRWGGEDSQTETLEQPDVGGDGTVCFWLDPQTPPKDKGAARPT